MESSQELDFDYTVPVSDRDSRSLLQILADAIGVDVTRITIPVSYNEPTTFLQRIMEAVTHCYLLKIVCCDFNSNLTSRPIKSLLMIQIWPCFTLAFSV
jgi:hypothetical protein